MPVAAPRNVAMRAKPVARNAWLVRLLPRMPLVAVHCYGFIREPEGRFSWLYLEKASWPDNSPLRDADQIPACDWLGNRHGANHRRGLKRQLPKRNAGYYLSRLRTSRSVIGSVLASSVVRPEDLSVLRSVLARCDPVEAHWVGLEAASCMAPKSVVPGDFVVKNRRNRFAREDREFSVFDREVTGRSVTASDLAQATGRVVSPDQKAYRTALARRGVRLDPAVIHCSAMCGKFFRLVDVIACACAWAVEDDYEFLKKPISFLRSYEVQLSEALHGAGWAN